jgi:hypothetical protein
MFRNVSQAFLAPLPVMDLKPPHLVIALRNTNKEEKEGEHGAKQGEGGNGCSN